MNVIVIGATGTIGSAVVEQLGQRHDIVGVGTRSGLYRADIADIAQMRAMFAQVGKIDAVVVAAGALHVGPFEELAPEHFHVGLNSKLMGQVNVALVARDYLNDGGSITLTSGVDTDHPIRGAVAACTMSFDPPCDISPAASDGTPLSMYFNTLNDGVSIQRLPECVTSTSNHYGTKR